MRKCVLCHVLLFVLRLNVPVNNFSVMSGRSHRFLGNEPVLSGSKVSCSRTQHGGGRYRTPDLSLRSPTLYPEPPRSPMPYANNKGADQPAQPHALISAFVVHCLDSIIQGVIKKFVSFPDTEKSTDFK